MLRIRQKPDTQMNLESTCAKGDIPRFSLCPSKSPIVPSELEFVQEHVLKEKARVQVLCLQAILRLNRNENERFFSF